MCMWHTIMHIRTRPCAPSCAGMSGYNAIPAGSKTMNNHEPDAPPPPTPQKAGLDVVQSHPLYKTCFSQ